MDTLAKHKRRSGITCLEPLINSHGAQGGFTKETQLMLQSKWEEERNVPELQYDKYSPDVCFNM